ncbi:MAG: tetratricopeptide repeat protein [Thermosynechococcaceae cyanobacterium]
MQAIKNLPLAWIYLALLLGLLLFAVVMVIRQVLQTRKTETKIERLQTKIRGGSGTVEDHFELGSIYLMKKLPGQAAEQFKKAIKIIEVDEEIPPESAPVYNALGFALFNQDQYDMAIRQYKEALEHQPDYVTALNNLGHVYEKKNLMTQALESYEKSLEQDPKNSTATRRVKVLRRRLVPSS